MIFSSTKLIYIRIRKFLNNIFSRSPTLFKYYYKVFQRLLHYLKLFLTNLIIELRNLLFQFEYPYEDFILKQETAKLLTTQFNRGKFNRYDIIVRYLAIENYFGKNDYGFELYEKMQEQRIGKVDNFSWEHKLKKLIKNTEKNGFYLKKPIIIDSNYQLVDGSHRFAFSLYFEKKEIPVRILYKKMNITYGIDWFKGKKFTNKEINLIIRKKNEIFRKWDIKNLIIREYLKKLLNPSKQTFGRGTFYQSLPQLNINGQRPTRERFKIYELEKILNKNQEILDIGSNVGFFDIFIAQYVKHIDAIDINKRLIYIGNIVKEYLKLKNISFYHSSFEDFKLDKKYDVIFLFAIYHWTSYSFPEFILKVMKFLKPNGYIIIESHNIHTIDKNFNKRISFMENKGFKKLWEGNIKDDGDIERIFAILQFKS